jgi:hypothetical protein
LPHRPSRGKPQAGIPKPRLDGTRLAYYSL